MSVESEKSQEQPRNVFRVETSIEGHPVTYNIVHSIHFITTSEKEIAGADALLLEYVGGRVHHMMFMKGHQYETIAAYAKKTLTPVAFVDIDEETTDSRKYSLEYLIKNTITMGTAGFLASKALKEKKMNRRSFLLGAASATAFASTPALSGIFATLADHRAGATSGAVAREVARLHDDNPLNPEIIGSLRNRVMAYKSSMVARFLSGVDTTKHTETSKMFRRNYTSLTLPIVVGAAHSDIGRLLLRPSEEIRGEIIATCSRYEMSPAFILSAGLVRLGQYNPKRDDWEGTMLIDETLAKEAFSRSKIPAEYTDWISNFTLTQSAYE